MKKFYLFLLFPVLFTCSTQGFTVSKILDGNTLELSNGVTVELLGVAKTGDNIKILERYTNGNITLFDNDNEEISSIKGTFITATIYNSDGDCINDLLNRVTQITKTPEVTTTDDSENTDKTTVKMQSDSGVYTIPVRVDGVLMYFIFDTGASLISISEDEASTLYNMGKLQESDFLGKSQFSDANGDITEGTIINLSTVQIGNRVLSNVSACVTHGQNAPLLLGQSALQLFGKVSIDYTKMEITFE